MTALCKEFGDHPVTDRRIDVEAVVIDRGSGLPGGRRVAQDLLGYHDDRHRFYCLTLVVTLYVLSMYCLKPRSPTTPSKALESSASSASEIGTLTARQLLCMVGTAKPAVTQAEAALKKSELGKTAAAAFLAWRTKSSRALR